jgi:hypothetical protein
MRQTSPLLCCLALLGCQEEPAAPTCAPLTEAAPLIDNQAWALASPAQDPFPDRPADATCDPAGYRLEGDIFEINTDACEYMTAVQTLRRDVQPCDTIQLVISYFPLFAAARAEAHVGLAFGSEVIWERRLPIPSPDDLIIARWRADRAWPAGTPVSFHLHNHGVNDWRLIDLSVVPEAALEGE